MREAKVDFPAPDGPTSAVMVPASMVASSPLSTGAPSAFVGQGAGGLQ